MVADDASPAPDDGETDSAGRPALSVSPSSGAGEASSATIPDVGRHR